MRDRDRLDDPAKAADDRGGDGVVSLLAAFVIGSQAVALVVIRRLNLALGRRAVTIHHGG